MTDASFVFAGWFGTAAVIAAYALAVRARARRARAVVDTRSGATR